MNFTILVLSASLVAIISAFCSLAEASVVGLSDLSIKQLRKKNQSQADKLSKVLKNRSKFLSSIILLNTMTNITGSMLVGTLAATVLSDSQEFEYVTYTSFLTTMTLCMLLFSEIKPKVFAAQRSVPVCIAIYYPLTFITWLLTPVVQAINGFLNNKESNSEDSINLVDIEHLISTASESGLLKPGETNLVINALNLRTKKAVDILDDDTNVISINVNDKVSNHKETILSLTHKKIVLLNHMKMPVGVALREDALSALVRSEDILFSNIMHRLPVVPDDYNLSCIAQEVKEAPAKLIAVTNSSGFVIGVIGLSDIKEILFDVQY